MLGMVQQQRRLSAFMGRNSDDIAIRLQPRSKLAECCVIDIDVERLIGPGCIDAGKLWRG